MTNTKNIVSYGLKIKANEWCWNVVIEIWISPSYFEICHIMRIKIKSGLFDFDQGPGICNFELRNNSNSKKISPRICLFLNKRIRQSIYKVLNPILIFYSRKKSAIQNNLMQDWLHANCLKLKTSQCSQV